MTALTLAYLHLATVLPAFFIGTWQLARPKGGPAHRLLGRVYVALMLTTAVLALFIPAQIGPRFLGHFGFIHGFSFLVLYAMPAAVLAARRGNIRSHKGHMIGVYVGGLLIAGGFAFAPGRMLNQWLFA